MQFVITFSWHILHWYFSFSFDKSEFCFSIIKLSLLISASRSSLSVGSGPNQGFTTGPHQRNRGTLRDIIESLPVLISRIFAIWKSCLWLFACFWRSSWSLSISWLTILIKQASFTFIFSKSPTWFLSLTKIKVLFWVVKKWVEFYVAIWMLVTQRLLSPTCVTSRHVASICVLKSWPNSASWDAQLVWNSSIRDSSSETSVLNWLFSSFFLLIPLFKPMTSNFDFSHLSFNLSDSDINKI